jgi:LysM repeat protein
LIDANPQLGDPSELIPGQIINIPNGESSEPINRQRISITPSNGPAGTSVLVSGSGFLANAQLNVGAAVPNSEPAVLKEMRTDRFGTFQTTVNIPFTARPGENWFIFANHDAGGAFSVRERFDVSRRAVDRPYIVKSGDTLAEIGARYDTSIGALMRANPQIADASLIFPGERVYLPGTLIALPNSERRAYIVERGDHLSEIAARYDTTVERLDDLNPNLNNLSLILPGQRIALPID